MTKFTPIVGVWFALTWVLLAIAGERDSVKADAKVAQTEVGKPPAELSEIAVVRLYRGREHFSVPNLPVIEKGDVLVYVAEGQTNAKGSET